MERLTRAHLDVMRACGGHADVTAWIGQLSAREASPSVDLARRSAEGVARHQAFQQLHAGLLVGVAVVRASQGGERELEDGISLEPALLEGHGEIEVGARVTLGGAETGRAAAEQRLERAAVCVEDERRDPRLAAVTNDHPTGLDGDRSGGVSAACAHGCPG